MGGTFSNLNRLRVGQQTENDIKTLKTRTVSTDDPNYPSDIAHLCLLKRMVKDHNDTKYQQCTAEKASVKCQDVILTDCPPLQHKRITDSLQTVDAYDYSAGLLRTLNIAETLT